MKLAISILFWLMGAWSIIGMVRSFRLRNYLSVILHKLAAINTAELEALAAADDYQGLRDYVPGKRLNELPGRTLANWAYICLLFWRPLASFVPQHLLDDIARAENPDNVLEATEVV